MGTWSTRIFDDDGASDIILEYKKLLGYGVSIEESYKKIQDYFYKDYKDQDDEDVYWLSIALFQWQNGILENKVKEKALQCIDEENYLERWKESGQTAYKKRKDILETLKSKLLYEVNPVKKKFSKCPEQYRIKTQWSVGDLIAYKIYGDPFSRNSNNEDIKLMAEKLFGKYILLRVVDVCQRPVTEIYPELDYTSHANMMIYDWFGDEIPTDEEITKLNFRLFAEKIDSVWEISSGVGIELNQKKHESYDEYEIIYLGNDSQFLINAPYFYKLNNGCPWKENAEQLNYTLASTFALKKDEKMRWAYGKDEYKA